MRRGDQGKKGERVSVIGKLLLTSTIGPAELLHFADPPLGPGGPGCHLVEFYQSGGGAKKTLALAEDSQSCLGPVTTSKFLSPGCTHPAIQYIPCSSGCVLGEMVLKIHWSQFIQGQNLEPDLILNSCPCVHTPHWAQSLFLFSSEVFSSCLCYYCHTVCCFF